HCAVDRSGCAVGTDHHAVLLTGKTAAVLHQETTRAGELVGLLRNDTNGQLFTRQVSAGQLERFSGFGFVYVDHRRGRLVPSCFELLQRIFRDIVSLGAPRSVIVGRHCPIPSYACVTSSNALYQRRTHPPNDSCPYHRPLTCDLRHTLGSIPALSLNQC